MDTRIQPHAMAPRGASLVRAVQAIALVLVLVYVVSSIPGVRSAGFSTTSDGWLETGAYTALAAVAWLRPLTSDVDRRLWTLIAAAVSLRALGYLLYITLVQTQSPPPYPSVADASWLGVYGFLIAALLVMVKTRFRGRSLSLAFDATLAGLTVAGLASEFLYGTLNRISSRNDPGEMVTTNLAWPILDVVLLVLVTGALVAVGWRSRATLMLAAAVALFALVDSTYAYEASTGNYTAGPVLETMWLVATAAIAFSAWLPDEHPESGHPSEYSPVLLPTVLAVVAVAGLLYATLFRVPVGGVLLTAAALVVGIGRAVVTIVFDRDTAMTAIRATNAELVKFQALVETSDDFIAMATPDGKILYINPSGRRMVGLGEADDVTAMTTYQFLGADDGERYSQVSTPLVLEHGTWRGESSLLHQSGEEPIPVAVSSFLMHHPDTGEPMSLATVQRDISERLMAEHALRRLADDRQDLLARLVKAQEDERARIAADVHDDSVQALAAVELRLGLMRSQLGDDDDRLVGTTDTLLVTVQQAIGRLRSLLFDLESPALESDLGTALSLAAEHVFEGGPRWRVVNQLAIDVPDGVRVTAYRVAREAMVNIVKHAEASEVVVRLTCADDWLEVVVDDDGVGADPAQLVDRPGHLGVGAMRDRASAAGGTVRFERGPVAGTRVVIGLPASAGRTIANS